MNIVHTACILRLLRRVSELNEFWTEIKKSISNKMKNLDKGETTHT